MQYQKIRNVLRSYTEGRFAMYEVEARWAGYLIEQHVVRPAALERLLAEIEARFEEGLVFSQHEIEMPLRVLTVDVFVYDGEREGTYRIIAMYDFKK